MIERPSLILARCVERCALLCALTMSGLSGLGLVGAEAKELKTQEEPVVALTALLKGAHERYASLAPHPKQRCARVGLRVHLTPRGAYNPSLLAQGEGGQETDLKWLSRQVSEANRLFKPLRVCFELTALLTHPASDARMKTRGQRSALGARGGFKRGVVELFIVDRLDDVDLPDAYIRGVHWRHPEDRARRRWVILSRVARPLVLAHELGHYFSLPHSEEPGSIMNKRPRATPALSERGFTDQERPKMRRAWRRMKKDGQLKPL